ncbi:hypothetical protein [Larkinella terrae]|uniref:Uncharacterized protein n=1 Tax=Larkinella terrae TaxID=2025311 RepID=A0A7K0ED13_9BACT|nr:hypothetical protein [Larkinella terrae]MRS59800.1 hypothetical protein [Larkinella terrae]
MRVSQVSRSQKMKILHELINGKPGPLHTLYDNRERDPSKMTDEELKAEHERVRQRVFRQTGKMPPPLPDFKAMSDEELRAHADKYRHAISDQSRKN